MLQAQILVSMYIDAPSIKIMLFHVSRNSSEIINSMITKTNTVIQGVLNPILIIISSIFIVIGIVSALISINVIVGLVGHSFGFGVFVCIRYLLHSNSSQE